MRKNKFAINEGEEDLSPVRDMLMNDQDEAEFHESEHNEEDSPLKMPEEPMLL